MEVQLKKLTALTFSGILLVAHKNHSYALARSPFTISSLSVPPFILVSDMNCFALPIYIPFWVVMHTLVGKKQ